MIGNGDYKTYLDSNHWRILRAYRLHADDNKCTKCTKCGSTLNLHVHHLSYDRLGKEKLKDIITLCRECHKNHHKGNVFQDIISIITSTKRVDYEC